MFPARCRGRETAQQLCRSEANGRESSGLWLGGAGSRGSPGQAGFPTLVSGMESSRASCTDNQYRGAASPPGTRALPASGDKGVPHPERASKITNGRASPLRVGIGELCFAPPECLLHPHDCAQQPLLPHTCDRSPREVLGEAAQEHVAEESTGTSLLRMTLY